MIWIIPIYVITNYQFEIYKRFSAEFSEVQFDNEKRELYEVELANWMHDERQRQ